MHGGVPVAYERRGLVVTADRAPVDDRVGA